MITQNNNEDYYTLFHWSKLHLLSKQGTEPDFEKTLAEEKDINKKDVNGNTPLHIACLFENLKYIPLLIKAGADINAVNNLGWSPLFLACAQNLLSAAKEILKYKPDINLKDNFGKTALHVCCLNGNNDLIKELLKYKPSINIQDDYGIAPLHIACASKNTDLAMELIKLGADIKLKDIYGCNLLHTCSLYNNFELLEKIIDQIDIEISDKFNNTALTIACLRSSIECALFLVKRGANLYVKNIFDQSPEELIQNFEINH
jgi:ankyrin repeat protein